MQQGVENPKAKKGKDREVDNSKAHGVGSPESNRLNEQLSIADLDPRLDLLLVPY